VSLPSTTASITLNQANRAVRLTQIQLKTLVGGGPDPAVIARLVYRSKIGVTPFELVGTINDNSTVEFIDRAADTNTFPGPVAAPAGAEVAGGGQLAVGAYRY